MVDIKLELENIVCDWAAGHFWGDEEEVSSVISSTNSTFTDWLCESVQLDRINERDYKFVAQIAMDGEPYKDDVPFCGDKIFIEVTGNVYYDINAESWVVGDDYEISAEVEDWGEDTVSHIIKQRVFKSVDDLFVAISQLSTGLWYRGHLDESWQLKSSIARQPNASCRLERNLRLEFEKQITFIDPSLHPLGIGKCNFLMQHHGVPTRLLDWTRSPLVALYFAVCDRSKDDVDACIWQLDPSMLNRFHGKKFPLECDVKNVSLFEENSDAVLAIHAPYTNLRMKMQMSEFTLHTNYLAMTPEIKSTLFLKEKLIISSAIKCKLRRRLRNLRIDRGFLFPDLDNIARTVREDILEVANDADIS